MTDEELASLLVWDGTTKSARLNRIILDDNHGKVSIDIENRLGYRNQHEHCPHGKTEPYPNDIKAIIKRMGEIMKSEFETCVYCHACIEKPLS